ncbi:hypothetical protein FOZ60_000733 [Perkinsus olseni]|uniref:Uncharacterized protein n=2 Tax=Perkinsus olseni TaxID=32597 RepID=A0A7J6MX37_PEROL|nr:hypothetical protein FOZ60_000733 [Perkinsus olseni]
MKMTFIIMMIAATAATMVFGGTAAPNTTSPSPDLLRQPGPTEEDLWWMLAEHEIGQLLESEAEAVATTTTRGPFDGVELPFPPNWGPSTSTPASTSTNAATPTSTTTTTGAQDDRLRGGVNKYASASRRTEAWALLVVIAVEMATLAII